jgi:hypothetical protein
MQTSQTEIPRPWLIGLKGDVSSTLQPGPPTSSKRGLCNATVTGAVALQQDSIIVVGHHMLLAERSGEE